MAQVKNDGGPAFPQSNFSDPERPYGGQILVTGGMTMRDYFAAQALSQIASFLAARGTYADFTPQFIADVAKQSYQYADAMLAERVK